MKNKGIIFITLLIFMSLSCIGCVDITSIIDSYAEHERNKPIEFVEEKYGIELEPVSYESGGFVSDADIIECHTEGLNPEHESVKIRISSKNGKTIYQDNYFNYIGRDMLEAHVLPYVEEGFDSPKIYLQNMDVYHPNDINYGSTVQDLFDSTPHYRISVLVFVKEDGSTQEEYEERMLAVEDAIKESGDAIQLKLLVVKEELYDAVDRYTISEFWESIHHSNKPDNENLFFIYSHIIRDGERQ